MDYSEKQFSDMFSLITGDKVSADFSERVIKKIEIEKEKRIKLREDFFQWFFISLCAVFLCLTMFLLNKYYFHAEFGSINIYIRSNLLEVKDMFRGSGFYHWSIGSWLIIGVNTIILILLEQFLSRKFSNKL